MPARMPNTFESDHLVCIVGGPMADAWLTTVLLSVG